MASNKGNSVVDDLKSGFKGIYSAGEAIRGTFNESVDHAFNDKTGEVKNQAIADQGVQGVKNTEQHFGGTQGVKTGGVSGSPVVTGDTTSAGTHSGAPGNLGGNSAGGVVQGSTTSAQESATSTQRY